MMVAKIAEVRLRTLLPVAILSMLPTLVGIDRIVTTAAGLERIPGGEPGIRVIGSVIIAKVIVAVVWSQKEVAGEYARINYRRR